MGSCHETIFGRPWLAPIHLEVYSAERHYAMASEMKKKLRRVGLRPTRTRVALAYMLFAQGNRHVSAEMLFEEANRTKVSVALATVYNTLHEFTKVGFLRQVAVDFLKVIFRYQQHRTSSLLFRR
jgi:Fur family iron response transcriptional regulator